MNKYTTQTTKTKVERKVRKSRQARQFEPSPIRDMDDFANQERRRDEMLAQVEESGDCLWA